MRKKIASGVCYSEESDLTTRNTVTSGRAKKRNGTNV